MASTATNTTSIISGIGKPDPMVMEAIHRGNSVVFFDIALGADEAATLVGRIKLELFSSQVGFVVLRCCMVQLSFF